MLAPVMAMNRISIPTINDNYHFEHLHLKSEKLKKKFEDGSVLMFTIETEKYKKLNF